MANPAKAPVDLGLEEQIKTGCNKRLDISYTDLNDTAGTAKTLVVDPYVARDLIRNAKFDRVTSFDGASITSLVFKFGWNGASVDDDNGLIESTEICDAGTEILAGGGRVNTGTVDSTFAQAEADVLNSLRALYEGLQAQEAGNLELVFTSTGANLTALTAGRLLIYYNHLSLNNAALRSL